MKLAAAVLSTAALLGWTACSNVNAPVAAGSMSKIVDAKIAPDFALKDSDGHMLRLSDYHGKVILLDFWATWCGPCKIEIPWFQEFERKYKSRGLVVLGIAEDDEGWPVVKPFLKELNINYRVAMGDDKTADLYGGLEALPTTFLIDRNGRITATHVGLTSKEDLEDAIEELLRKPAQDRADNRADRSPGVIASGADGAKVDGL